MSIDADAVPADPTQAIMWLQRPAAGGSVGRTDGQGGTVVLARAAASADLRGRSPVFAFRIDDRARCGDLSLRLGSSPADFYSWLISADPLGRPTIFDSDEPVTAALSFADADVTGAPDRSALRDWALIAADAGNGPVTAQLRGFGWLPEPDAFPHGLVTLSFDDSFASQWVRAFPALSEAGLPGTLVPIIERLDRPGYLTGAQVDAMAAAGWEICAHATTEEAHRLGLHRMTPEQRRAELAALRAWQEERGYGAGSYAYPGGHYSALAGADVLEHFPGARTAYSGLRETWPPAQRDRVRGLVVKAATHPDLEAYRAEIARARDHRAWVVLTFHGVGVGDGDGDGVYDVELPVLRGFCAELARSGVAVRTLGGALRGAPAAGRA